MPLIWTRVDGPLLHFDRSFDRTCPDAWTGMETASNMMQRDADTNFDMTH